MTSPRTPSSTPSSSGSSTGQQPTASGRATGLTARRAILLLVAATVTGLVGRSFVQSNPALFSGLAEALPESGIAGPVRPAQFGGGRPQFDLSDATIPVDQIRAGGPPKDGIPALTNPPMITAAEAAYLGPDDRVIGYVDGDEARAYPLRILNHHELVNDRVAGKPILVTYCPLCDSAAIFDRRTPLGEREFGVSGLLYNSNVLMYDRGGQPESLWSQVKGAGVSGPAADQKLTPLPVELTTWKDWINRYPHTRVLSPETGHRRDYNRNPYAGYFTSPRLVFPVESTSDRLPTKAPVLGVWVGDASRAYPVSAFGSEAREFEDTVGGRRLTLAFEPNPDRLRVVSADDDLQWMYSLWYAWYAFRPETEVYQP